MSKATLILAVTAALGLAACSNDPATSAANANLVPLLDNTGRAVVFAPASAVRNAPVGTPVVINRGGSVETLTVGERQGGTSSGAVTVVGTTDGTPQIVRVGGTGDVSRPGAAVVTGNTDGRPTTEMVDPATLPQSRRQRAAAERARARAAAAATPAAAR